MVLKEELLGKLIHALRHHLHREPSSYHFIMEQKNHTLDDFSYLERYLRSESIAFQAIGISLRSQCLLPVSMVADTDYGKFPTGLYVIYPETDREVIFYFYLFVHDLMRDVPRYIVCCRDLVTLNLVPRRVSKLLRRPGTRPADHLRARGQGHSTARSLLG